MAAWAALAGLRLVVKAGSAGGGDVLDQGMKWRCGVGGEFVRGVARGVGCEMEKYVLE